jgi:hypothetical protein
MKDKNLQKKEHKLKLVRYIDRFIAMIQRT